MDAYALSLKFQTEGFDDVFRKLDQVDQKGARVTRTAEGSGASIERIGHKAAGVAIALSGMEQVGVSAVEKIAHGATNIAFMFGEAGPIVAAAAITGVAIFTIFTSARKQMEETDQKARTLLKNLTLDTGARQMGELYSGNVEAAPGSPAALGLERARQRAAELTRTTPARRFGAGSGLQLADQFDKQRDELKDLNEWILKNGKAYDDVKAKVGQLTQVEVDRAKLIVAEGDRAKAEDLAKLGLTRATGAASEALHAAEAVIAVIAQAVNKRIETDIAPNVEKLLQDSVAKGLSKLPLGSGEGIASAGLNPKTGLGAAFGAHLEELARQMSGQITSIFGASIREGFVAAFSHVGDKGFGGVFKALGKSILSGLGSVFVAMGEKMVAASALMMGFGRALAAFDGLGGIGIGLAMMLLGGGMMAAGSVAWRGDPGGAAGSGGGYSAGSGYNNTQDQITRIRLMPGWAQGSEVSPRSHITVNATIIGKNDPQAQRDIKELIQNAVRRGLRT